MGRWRPPQPRGSAYITPAGYDGLQRELQQLWLRRRDVVRALSAAAAEGDRSENAEYIYRKKELGGIDRRIRYLQKRLPDLKIVTETPQRDRVYFGAWVRLETEDGEEKEYRLVGPDETDGERGRISIDSPLARALLGRGIDDVFSLEVGGRAAEYVIVGIRYTQAGSLSPSDDTQPPEKT